MIVCIHDIVYIYNVMYTSNFTCTSKLTNYDVEYRDGIKSRGDKIGMPCTHTTVI